MNCRTVGRRVGVVGLLVLSLVVLSGCSYLKYRVDDLTDVMDLGFTVTKTPQFSAYINCPTVIPLGWGKVDGLFWGVADGKVGWLRHKREEKGWIFGGKEQLSFKNFDEKDSDELRVEGVGLYELAVHNKTAKKRPMCIHHLHLGWLGVIWNVRYREIADLALGFAGLDYRQDDGPNGGWWFKKNRAPASTESVLAKAEETPSAQPVVLATAETSMLDKAREAVAVAREDTGRLAKEVPTLPAPTPVKVAKAEKATAPVAPTPSPLSPAKSDYIVVAKTEDLNRAPVAKPVTVAPKRPEPTLVASTTAPKPVIAGAGEYVVQRGDSLARIAKKQYGDVRRWREIYEANRETISSPNLIRPGMKLTIPGKSTPTVAGTTAAADTTVYTVKPGDTLYAISRKMYGDSTKWKLLYETNRQRLGLNSPSGLRPTMRLMVPVAN